MPDPEEQPTDSGVVVDAGVRADAGQQIQDAGTEPYDAGQAPEDAGVELVDAGLAEPIDAGTEPHDAGVIEVDAGTYDAGTTVDAGTIVDAGTTFDAGVPDAGSPTGPINGCPGNDCTANVLVIGGAGTTHFGVFQQGTAVRNRMRQPSPTVEYDTCVVAGGWLAMDTYYGMVEVRNPNAAPAKVELRLDSAPNGAYVYSYLAAYAAVPTSDTEAAMCLTGVNDGCMEPDEDAIDDRWACLAGSGAPTIPANGSIWAYVPLHSPPNQPAGSTPTPFQLRAKNVTP